MPTILIVGAMRGLAAAYATARSSTPLLSLRTPTSPGSPASISRPSPPGPRSPRTRCSILWYCAALREEVRMYTMGPLFAAQVLVAAGKVRTDIGVGGEGVEGEGEGRCNYVHHARKAALNMVGKLFSLDRAPHSIAVALVHAASAPLLWGIILHRALANTSSSSSHPQRSILLPYPELRPDPSNCIHAQLIKCPPVVVLQGLLNLRLQDIAIPQPQNPSWHSLEALSHSNPLPPILSVLSYLEPTSRSPPIIHLTPMTIFSAYRCSGTSIRARRYSLRQEMLLRALRGAYTAYSRNHDISGAAFSLFALACGQVMYAFTVYPDILSRSYENWIMGAAGQCKDGVKLNYVLRTRGCVIASQPITAGQSSSDVISDITSAGCRLQMDRGFIRDPA
ncbi:hypothetical protein FB451DRAFT_1566257 [Mycena latifolia]|nr:hypothetical protein FB451DRAFT_1566257 [Mycena latifolia]